VVLGVRWSELPDLCREGATFALTALRGGGGGGGGGRGGGGGGGGGGGAYECVGDAAAASATAGRGQGTAGAVVAFKAGERVEYRGIAGAWKSCVVVADDGSPTVQLDIKAKAKRASVRGGGAAARQSGLDARSHASLHDVSKD